MFNFSGIVALDEEYEHGKFDLTRIDVRMDSLTQDQRREFSRAYFRPPLAASLGYVGVKKKKAVAVDIVNLSAAGAGVLAGEPIEHGAEIRLEFLLNLPEGEQNISITGECIRRTDIDHPRYRYYIGIGFKFAGRRLPNELKRYEETQRIIIRAVDQQNILNAQRKERFRKQ
ncbi:MAG: PilZ domain-containing protein [Planctomycetota bacterium]